MKNCLIIDDDPVCCTQLRQMLLETGKAIEIKAECHNILDGYEAIIKYNPNLIFLDVEMPGGNGFDLLAKFDHIEFDIIFTTAYDKYSLQAIRASALDFLLKPFSFQDLLSAIDRFETMDQLRHTRDQVKVLLQNLQCINAEHKIVVPTGSGLEFLKTADVLRLESESNYTKIYLVSGSRLVVAKTLKELEDIFPSHIFFRIHHSHLINTRLLKRFHKRDGGIIEMEDGSEVPLARLRKDAFLDFIKNQRV